MRRVSLLLLVALSLSTAASAATQVVWTGADNDKWNDPTKWSTTTVPGESMDIVDTALIRNGTNVILDTDQTGKAGQINEIHVYMNASAAGPSTLTVNTGAKLDLSNGYWTGSATAATTLYVGSNFGPIVPAGTGYYVQNGGDVKVNMLSVGYFNTGVTVAPIPAAPIGRMTFNGGTFTANPLAGAASTIQYIGRYGNAELILNGGTVNLNNNSTGSGNHVAFAGNGTTTDPSSALVQVNDGVLNIGMASLPAASGLPGATTPANNNVYFGGAATAGQGGAATMIINGGTVNFMHNVGFGNAGGMASLTVSGTGQLNVGQYAYNEYFNFGGGTGGSSTFLQSGGTIKSLYLFGFGRSALATIGTQSGGSSYYGMGDLGWGFASGGFGLTGQANSLGVFTLSGGTMECEGMTISRANGAVGTFNFTGGVLKTHDSWSITNTNLAGTKVWSPALSTWFNRTGTNTFNWTGGKLMVSGTVQLGRWAGNVFTNAGGVLSPYYSDSNGTTTSTVGTVQIWGGYNVTSSAASLELDVNGATTAGTDYDQVLISTDTAGGLNKGNLSLGGSQLSITMGYTPSTTGFDTLNIVTLNDATATITGTFAGKAEGALFAIGSPASSHQTVGKVSYIGGSGNDIVLSLRSVRQADGDANGLVDQRDYALWFNNNGLNGKSWATGDWDNNGLVDQRDYALWFNNNGLSGDSGAVPEPATMGLLILGAAGLLRKRR